MATDWDEIRRLASDLQRAQLRGAIQKLSERNCIEIVTNLIGQGLLEVLYTADGKEYLTAQQLNREIRDELFVARGRISLVELAQILNVDFSHVEYQAQSIAKPSGPVHLILGQLVDSRYLDSLAEEVNEKLQLEGILNVSNLAKEADLLRLLRFFFFLNFTLSDPALEYFRGIPFSYWFWLLLCLVLSLFCIALSLFCIVLPLFFIVLCLFCIALPLFCIVLSERARLDRELLWHCRHCEAFSLVW